MADVTYTLRVSDRDSYGTSQEVSTDLDAGNDVILDPPTKGISVNLDAFVDVILAGDGTTNTVRKYVAGGIHKNVFIKKIIAATTDAAAGIHVYGD